jgi:iron complex outermembrane receptor protein
MSCIKHLLYLGLCAAIAASSAAAFAQTGHPQTWAQDIAYMESLPPAEAASQQSTILQIRAEVELWIKIHPESKLSLAPLPKLPLSADQAAYQVKELDRVIAEIIKLDPTHPFHLGAVQVNVTASVSALSPQADSIDDTEMAKQNEVNAAQAMENLPGVSVTHTYSGRNQEQISIHGFSYLQVPLYVDGVLMNDPYDGTLDFRQIPTTDIAQIQVAKGFSSAMMGPNAVGGAINIVTKEPQKKYEGELLTEGYAGDGFLSSIRLGSRWNHFFAQGSMDWMQDDSIPLSGNFVTNIAQPVDQLNHSYAHNATYNGRIGWTPKGQDEYVFSYMSQKAKSGMPLTTGNDPLPGSPCSAASINAAGSPTSCYASGGSPYRSWSFWDKVSYHFHSDTELGQKSSLKTRVFYDQYPNLMYFYTGLPYSAATLRPSFITLYDDHSDGFSTEFDTKLVKRNAIGGSFYFKDDTHKEFPMLTPASGPNHAVDRQQIAAIGLQDVITITSQLTVTAGFSADHIDGLTATNTGASVYEAFISPQCPRNTNPDNFSACTPHQWAYNPQVSAVYTFKDSSRLFVGFTEKSRFPVLKDMFSYKLGKGIPNPNLKTEHSANWEIGYSRVFAKNTSAQVEYFRSDLRDAIESIPAPLSLQADYPGACSSPTSCSVNENASHETHQGAELTLHSTPVSRLTLDANYTYVNKEIDGFTFPGLTTSGSEVYPCYSGDYLVTGAGSNAVETATPDNTCLTPIDLPKHKAVAMATLHLPYKAMLNSTLRYEGGNKAIDSYKDSTNKNYYIEAIPMSHFATWDVGGTVPLYKGATLQAGVKNLLDRNYYQTLDIPEEGRNWFVNMRYRF